MQRIGTFTLAEATTRRTSEEVAAWYTKVAFEPQTVEVFAVIDERGRAKDTSLGYTLNGAVVDAHYPALFGGVAMTDGARPELHGRPHAFAVRPYAHSVALAMLRGDSTGITLDEGVEALYVGFGDPAGEDDRFVGYTADLIVNPTDEDREASEGIAAGLDERGCVKWGASAAWKLGYAQAKAALARELQRRAESAASSARSVARDAERMAAAA